MERKTTVAPSAVFSIEDCAYAVRIVTRDDNPAMVGNVHEYASTSPLWPKLVSRAAPRFLARFIVTNFLIPLVCEFVRAERAAREPDPLKLAAIWRLYALKCAETERSSEVPDAGPRELRRWLPENQRAAKRRRVTCSKCRKKFRISVNSNLTRCFDCRYPGMRGSKRVRKAENTPLEAA